MKNVLIVVTAVVFFCVVFFLYTNTTQQGPEYQYYETRELVTLVRDAAKLIASQGPAAFPELKQIDSPWRHGSMYIFVLDLQGNMVMHPDKALEGKNQLQLQDINGKLIIQNLIRQATADPDKEGWFHYLWPEPGSMFPLWKTTCVKLVTTPSGEKYIVGSGFYKMRMEKKFIMAVVDAAADLIEKEGKGAFAALRDKAGPFNFLDTYVFVDAPDGTELLNPAFPNLEGKNLIHYQDPAGKYLVREYIQLALTKGSGWIDYLWPKPTASTPSPKHTYVRKAVYGSETFIVGSGAYLE